VGFHAFFMLKYFSVFILLIVFLGCSTTKQTTPKNVVQPAYTLVYVIHGDGNYTYHLNSKKYQADEEALAQAMSMGESAKTGEVLIFHQKPERKRLLFFPKKDRVFYHYNGGELVEKTVYSPIDGGLEKESDLFARVKSGSSKRAVLLYYGHEIPSDSSLVYHRSQPGQNFDINTFADDVGDFRKKFDLVILSTCNNGSPAMAKALTGKADLMVASPRNLHLSHLQSSKLNMLEEDPAVATELLADSIAVHSFDRLSGMVQTMVTVGVYNLKKTSDYLDGYAKKYEAYLSDRKQETLFTDNSDCNTLPFIGNEKISDEGTKLYFKPAAFGREARLKYHSAWGCKQID